VIDTFLQAIRENEDLHLQLRGVTTAAGLAEVAQSIGLDIPPAAIVKGFAQLLLDSSDSMAIRNFDNVGWDVGELLWVAKTWELADEAKR
jgi:hypothetical protein